MEKIEEVALSRFRNNEHFQYLTEVDRLVNANQVSALNLDSIYPEFKNLLNKEDNAMRTELGSIRSKTIEKFDALRDNSWKAIYLRVKANELSPIAAEVESAQIIKRAFDLYGDVRSLSYNEESAAINNLTNDLMQQPRWDHVTRLGLQQWVAELRSANDQFQSNFNLRSTEFSGRESGNVRAIRLQIDPIYSRMVNRINASIELNIASYQVDNFTKELNEKIRYYQIRVNTRTASGKDDDQPNETTTTS